MTKILMRTMTLMTLMSLTACDYVRNEDYKKERKELQYQEAMAEFKAGNLKAAVKKLEGAVRENPANMSARFLLATLQYEQKDYLSAFCNYREFISFAPDSDKIEQAKTRYSLCEEEVARALAKKLHLTDNAAIAQESETARKELAAAEKKLADSVKELDELRARAATLQTENVRLRRMIATVGEEGSGSRMKVEDVKDLLDDDEGDRLKGLTKAKSVSVDDEESAGSMASGLAAAKELIEDSSSEGKSSVLPDQGKTAKSSGQAFFGTKREEKTPADDPSRNGRPSTYVVQEGETLGQIAIRFYGRKSAWKEIREANKATIPPNGSIKYGQEIVLP